MNQSRKLREFVRIDGSGRDIPSTNVLRKVMPKNGRWKEVIANECCNYPTKYYLLNACGSATTTYITSPTEPFLNEKFVDYSVNPNVFYTYSGTSTIIPQTVKNLTDTNTIGC